MTAQVDHDADVVIVGAGPVGMSAALCLARHGLSSLVLERRETASHHPKARGVRLRTVELLRLWGIEPELRSRALPAEARRFIYCDSLAGTEIGRSPAVGVEEEPFSPTTTLRVAQDSVEQALRARVLAEPLIELRTGTEATAVQQNDVTVTVTTRPALADAREVTEASVGEVRGRYVIAADGVGSTLRRALGIDMQGQQVIAYWQSIYWHGDIDRWAADRPCIQFFTGGRTGIPATVASVDGHRRWVTMVTLPPSDVPPDALDGEAAVAVVRNAVGEQSLQVEVIDVATWRLSAVVAERWRDQRVFLAGDAAHSFPPTGGFGMNTGVQDVHNLAWKLGLVVRGLAQDGLLDSYENERRPVAESNASWSVANGSRVREINQAIAAGDDLTLTQLLQDQREHVLALQQDLGFVYRSSAVASGERTPVPNQPFSPELLVGMRAPHSWLRISGRLVSTIDLFDDCFVLLTNADDGPWQEALANLPAEDSMPAVRGVSVAPGRDAEADANFYELYRLTESGAVLVRPDGHVAWHQTDATEARRLPVVLRELTT